MLTGFILNALTNHSSRRHRLASTLTKRILLSISVRIESWSSQHSVNIHVAASLLEVRHHGWCLEHTEKFSEFF